MPYNPPLPNPIYLIYMYKEDMDQITDSGWNAIKPNETNFCIPNVFGCFCSVNVQFELVMFPHKHAVEMLVQFNCEKHFYF